MYEIKAYQCSYCKKYGKSKSNITKHEATCFRNPITRSCSTCANRDSYLITDPVFGAPFTTEVPYCLEGVSFVNTNVDATSEVRRKIKMHTNCAKWVERPYDDEELFIYQRTKNVDNMNKVISNVIDKDETPF